MRTNFMAHDSQNAAHSVYVETAPDYCPLCHVAIDPLFHLAFFRDNDYPEVRNNHVQAVVQCPRNECRKLFIAYYFQRNEGGLREMAARSGAPPKYKLLDVAPYSYQKKNFPDSVEKLSPSFCAIFNEAAEAESRKLKNIAGPGYRKSLEFLIKDFLVAEYPSDAEQIKKEWLGNLIRDKIPDANIKQCAQNATWLGNDETHYLRVWKDKDIEDLKTLLRLTVNWVENHLLTKKYAEEMKKGG